MKCRLSGPRPDLLSQHLVLTRSSRNSCACSSLRSPGLLEQWSSALAAWSASKIVTYLIWGCGLGFGDIYLLIIAPQVILIAARIENHCFGHWGAMESLKQDVVWSRRPRNGLVIFFPKAALAYRLWSHKEPLLPQ